MKLRRVLGAPLFAAALTTCGTQLPVYAQDHADTSKQAVAALSDTTMAAIGVAPATPITEATKNTAATTDSATVAAPVTESVKTTDPATKAPTNAAPRIRSANSALPRKPKTKSDPLLPKPLPGTLGALMADQGKVPTWYAKRAASLAQAQTPPAGAAPAPAAPTSRALPDPIDNPPFPFTAWTTNSGLPIGENWDTPPGPLQHALFGTKYDKTPWRIVGWLDAGANISSSKNSNLPLTYDFASNKVELDQLVVEFMKMPDTVQKDHIDWGFLSAHLFGIDYRFTTAAGYLNDQLNTHNNLYGYDPVLQWFMVYFPKISDGAILQVGRYISPIDIEAQLSNQNYLYSHSLMFGVDPYTYTGMNMEVRVNKEFMYFVGIHAGNENSPWSGRALPNAELLVGWEAANGKDQLWGGLDSLGSGKTVKGHDNEQILNFVWGHVWNKRLHMQTQSYYMWQYDPIKGGTPNNGPVYSYGGGGGKANAYGFVNNLEYKVNNRDYISFRSGYLGDPTGWRTGYNNRYCDFTLGYSHLFNSHIWFRPEIGFQHGFDTDAFDNGTKRDQVTVGADVLYRF